MTLVKSCGNNQTIFELLSLCIKEHNTLAGPVDGWAWAIVQKTKAEYPADCGTQLTFEEKLAQCISFNCEDNTAAINVVIESCSCLTCGDELPCHTADLPFFEKGKRTFCYTTDGEWALYFLDITDNMN